MIFQPYRCASNIHAALAGPSELLGRVYIDHRDFFLSLDDAFLPNPCVYDQRLYPGAEFLQ